MSEVRSDNLINSIKNEIEKRIDEIAEALKKEHIVVVSKTCPNCKIVLYALKESIEMGFVKVIYTDSKEFEELSKKVKIEVVPTYIIKEKDKDEYKIEKIEELLYMFSIWREDLVV